MGEIIDLPISQRRAVLMDCTLDIIANSSEIETVASSQDLAQVIRNCVDANIRIEPQLEKLSFIKDLGIKLELFINSSSISESERLTRALQRAATEQVELHRVTLVVHGDTVAVRVPDYDDKNLGQVDNLGKYLRWGCALLGLKNPKVKILKDPTLGKTVALPGRIERMMDNTIASLSLPSIEVGERAEFKSGLKANLPELLAATRLLRKYSGTLQKGVAPKGKKTSQTTLEDLRKSINGRAGLGEHGLDLFSQLFVKAIFNEITKPNFRSFPGGWLHSLKVSNGTKNNIGIIYKLGYECRVVSMQKVIHVVNNTVRPKKGSKPIGKTKDGKQKFASSSYEVYLQDDQTNPDGITHQEFRLAAFLALPLIDPNDKTSPKDQLSRDPLAVRDRTVLGFYSKNRDVVDTLNLAYATKAAIGKKNSKATPLGFRSARNHAIRLTANRTWMDATGKEYQMLSQVPEHTRNFLLKFFRRKLTKEEDEPSDEEDDEEEFVTPKTGSGKERADN
jgi:hypothetical protein